MIGQLLLHYRVVEKIGEGGQGTVYKVIDTTLDRPAVIKVLPPDLTDSASNLARFEREAKLASSLDHPNICTIFGLHKVGDIQFIAMQYVDGETLDMHAEMMRVTRPSGMIAAYVWDYAGQMQLIRRFWDAATSLDEDRFRAALRQLNPGPLKFVLNTHWHGDHTGGNEKLVAAGFGVTMSGLLNVDDVYAAVIVEALILDRDERVFDLLRNVRLLDRNAFFDREFR